MTENQLIPNLFRSEYSKIIAVLCKKFGLSNIQIAEDIVSDTFLKASETWGLKGVPNNPTAWLYKVAKNKTIDYFRHENTFINKVLPEIKNKYTNVSIVKIDLSEHNIKDSQLQMLFAVCNPIISIKNQITFALRVLCGFGIDEISNALLTNNTAINKRLTRTKKKLRTEKINLKFPNNKELEVRLDNVLTILYLLFNEGYYSSTSNKSVKKELSIEAMRLLHMLLNYKPTSVPKANALMALFCFQSSRFDARIDTNGKSILFKNQDRKKWNYELIEKGEFYLNLSSKGIKTSKYHLEAAIAFWHSRIETNENEKWNHILQLYNRLIQISYSPIIALNRTYALSKVKGKKIALTEALKINLKDNHLYHTLIADLYNKIDKEKQINHLKKALKLADTKNDKLVIINKLKALNN